MALQDCFSSTDWSMFRQAATYNNNTDLQEYRYCLQEEVHQANQKPWLIGKVHRLLKAENAAIRVEDKVGLRTARANLSGGIREAKGQ